MNDFALKVLNAKSGETHLFSVGQAGFILKSKSGQLLGVDLYLSDCVEQFEGHMGFKRLLPKILDPFDLEFDYIVATHPHFDHFDSDSIPKLMSNKKTQLYASMNCAMEVKRLNMADNHITYVREGALYEAGDYLLEFVPCDHGTAAPDSVGLVVTVDGKKIYITGDTCLRLDWADEFAGKGVYDIMVAPINGAFGNMNEQDCAELSNALKPKLTVPCHYGMFAAHGGNPGLFMEKMQRICPENKYFLMALGEGIAI